MWPWREEELLEPEAGMCKAAGNVRARSSLPSLHVPAPRPGRRGSRLLSHGIDRRSGVEHVEPRSPGPSLPDEARRPPPFAPPLARTAAGRAFPSQQTRCRRLM